VLFCERLAQSRVTTLVLVPSLLTQLLELKTSALETLDTLVCSGESLSVDLIRRVKARYPRVRLYNFYGSSEVNGDVTAGVCSDSNNVAQLEHSLVGRPIWNTRYTCWMRGAVRYRWGWWERSTSVGRELREGI